jgi:mono/diheme cytochrome c family protein
MSAPGFEPFPWERVLWSGRPSGLLRLIRRRERYFLTDCRIVTVEARGASLEIPIDELGAADLACTPWQRVMGVSTVRLSSRGGSPPVIDFHDIRHGPQLLLAVQWLASEREIDETLFADAAGVGARDPFGPGRSIGGVLTALLLAGVLGAVAVGHTPSVRPIVYPPDDAIAPGGYKRSQAEIVAFMERDVMPFARRTLGPLVGGADRVSCATCHGADGESRNWQMPGVRALPAPEFREAGLERFSDRVTAQMRNAIYGYLADERKQATVGYMRSVVMPGMAKLLNRPTYDFTQTYDYNRSHAALGCYHCHRIN